MLHVQSLTSRLRSNVTGGYVKTEKTNYDRPAYYNEEGNTWLLYDGRARLNGTV